MLKVLTYLYNLYKYVFDELSDPRSSVLLFMGNPLPVILIIALYLKFVIHWGPNFMKNRKPCDINNILIAYNAIQIVMSAYIFVIGVKYTYFFGGYNFFCEPVDKSYSPTALTIVSTGHFYFLVKVIDLLDTVFFVVRRKWSQITFLHVYHHAGMVCVTWLGVKFLPGGHSSLVAMLNSAVHFFMYSYYLVVLIKKNQQNIWWKKYITQLQIIQFLILALHFLSLLIHPYCGYPKWIGIFISIQNLFMLFMFLDFYYKAYIKKRPIKESSEGNTVPSKNN